MPPARGMGSTWETNTMHFVFTLGFHSDHIIRTLARKAVGRVERITLITAEPVVKRTEDAYKNVVSYTDKASLPTPNLVPVDVGDPPTAIEKILDALGQDKEYYADLTGGMRAVVVYTLIALILKAKTGANITLHTTSEDPQQAQEAEINLQTITTILLEGIKQTKAKIAQHLLQTGKPQTIADLAHNLKLGERTLKQHISWLRNRQF
ncbi:MAG TPA: CRISPR locus-related DNA-binding protein, partial [Pyrodictium sp.]|nr:CRISPR locus-related DNA-binding protein [Pyrodictium sp.]